MNMKNRNEKERPRERLLRGGVSTLSTEELLAVLLQSGPPGSDVLELSRSLYEQTQTLEQLSRLSPAELLKFRGIGPAKACCLSAALELGRRLAAEGLQEGQVLNQPEDSGNFLVRIYRSERQEIFGSIFMDRRNRILAYRTLFTGTRDAAPVDAAELFRRALMEDASRLIVFHNHPTGHPEPSADDRALTRRLVEGASLVGLELLDHIILAGPRWISLRSSEPGLFARNGQIRTSG